MDYEELKKKTVTQLKEMAEEHEEITDVTVMKKDDLLNALSKKLGIAKPVTKKKIPEKGAIKAKIKELKTERGKALEASDAKLFKKVRKQIHRQKGLLRRNYPKQG